MGTDIHFFAEKRNHNTGAWEYLPAPEDGFDYRESRRIRERDGNDNAYQPKHPYRWGGGNDDEDYIRSWFTDRNYTLFGMLADVRNGSGFAGCDLGDPLEVIAQPRGWPADLSPELEAERADIEHTPCWLTVAEMQTFFGRKRVEDYVRRGVVDGATYERLRDTGEVPRMSSGGISGPGIITVAPGVYDLIPADVISHEDSERGFRQSETKVRVTDLPTGVMAAEQRDFPEFARVYVQCSWVERLDGVIEDFESCLAEMVEVAGVPASDIRAVFYFDS